VTIEIGDTGPGIDPDILPEIFDPFFTTKKRGRASGSRSYARSSISMGGRIDLVSAPGQGTRVRVELQAGEARN